MGSEHKGTFAWDGLAEKHYTEVGKAVLLNLSYCAIRKNTKHDSQDNRLSDLEPEVFEQEEGVTGPLWSVAKSFHHTLTSG